MYRLSDKPSRSLTMNILLSHPASLLEPLRAVEQGKVNKIRSYLQSALFQSDKELWNMTNKFGDTPLLVAAKDKEISMMHLLCSNWPTVDLDAQDRQHGMTTCMHLVLLKLNYTSGDDILDFFLNHADLSLQDKLGWNVAHFCAFSGNVEVMEKLLFVHQFEISPEAGADIARGVGSNHHFQHVDHPGMMLSVAETGGSSGALRSASFSSDPIAITTGASQGQVRGTNKPQAQRVGTTLSDTGPKKKHRIAQRCATLADGALAEEDDVDDQTTDDQTTEEVAAQAHFAIGEKILEVHSRSPTGRSKMAPISEESLRNSAALKRTGMGLGSEYGEAALPPLHIACASKRLDVVSLLVLQCGMNVNEQHVRTGSLPIHHACRSGDVRIVNLLLDHKATLFGFPSPCSTSVGGGSAEEDRSWTPLHLAALYEKDHAAVVGPTSTTTLLEVLSNHIAERMNVSKKHQRKVLNKKPLFEEDAVFDVGRGFASGRSRSRSPGSRSPQKMLQVEKHPFVTHLEPDYDLTPLDLLRGKQLTGFVSQTLRCIPARTPEVEGAAAGWLKICGFCGKRNAELLCKKCFRVFYCSPECQHADWGAAGGGHKALCGYLRGETEQKRREKQFYAANNRESLVCM
eukprot:CAMPEP_0178994908 /NCGR_PEP_ID=MMETSP0795-20121207/7549_1 /TAXON_ID=88552 /ORGANISM="Amoebophrya sp., Strain Ameob2" /LENGTH=629 /DNA_ID=CAMNT_0020687189 /DNA_START=760 /DNA_END=2650 /DNA_ORIENTATION=+